MAPWVTTRNPSAVGATGAPPRQSTRIPARLEELTAAYYPAMAVASPPSKTPANITTVGDDRSVRLPDSVPPGATVAVGGGLARIG